MKTPQTPTWHVFPQSVRATTLLARGGTVVLKDKDYCVPGALVQPLKSFSALLIGGFVSRGGNERR